MALRQLLAHFSVYFSLSSILSEGEALDELQGLVSPDGLSEVLAGMDEVASCRCGKCSFEGLTLQEGSGGVDFEARFAFVPSPDFLTDEQLGALEEFNGIFTEQDLALGGEVSEMGREAAALLSGAVLKLAKGNNLSLVDFHEPNFLLVRENTAVQVANSFSLSHAEARRIVEGGGLKVNGEPFSPGDSLAEGDRLQIGHNRQRTL